MRKLVTVQEKHLRMVRTIYMIMDEYPCEIDNSQAYDLNLKIKSSMIRSQRLNGSRWKISIEIGSLRYSPALKDT